MRWIVRLYLLSEEILDSKVLDSFVTDANDWIFNIFTLLRLVFCINFAMLHAMFIK